MTRFFKSIDYRSGQIISMEEDLTSEDSIEQQVEILREDLIQVEYLGNYVLDVGWYPSFDLSGAFRVFVVKNSDWEKPLYDRRTSNLQGLREVLEDAIRLIESKL